MPIKSLQQQKLMYATLGGAHTGVPKAVAQEFVDKTPKNQFKKIKAQLKGQK